MTTSHTETPTWPPAPPLIAILRGLENAQAVAVGHVLFDAGFRALEVPLNRPQALASIEALVRIAPAGALVGAGTVTDTGQIDAVAAAGGRLIVSPHLDVALVAHARARSLFVVPGVFTPSEAFAALRAGADALKFFPAEILAPAGLRALLSVLPTGTRAWPVGGITPESLARWREAGANGFGIGGALFKPGVTLADLAAHARAFVVAWQLTDT
jgi:2-dehydro-3-deoxyphosphogalactonate aldolase